MSCFHYRCNILYASHNKQYVCLCCVYISRQCVLLIVGFHKIAWKSNWNWNKMANSEKNIISILYNSHIKATLGQNCFEHNKLFLSCKHETCWKLKVACVSKVGTQNHYWKIKSLNKVWEKWSFLIMNWFDLIDCLIISLGCIVINPFQLFRWHHN